ncbi:MAG: hypothetical protein K0U47_03050 [Epsilonproteobacteria bacterium]|nr:hypothetical protein [Campylobacterota bacterium]
MSALASFQNTHKHEVITPEMHEIKNLIMRTYAKREALKKEMQCWYEEHQESRFERTSDLMLVDTILSELDSRYKILWDYHNKKAS